MTSLHSGNSFGPEDYGFCYSHKKIRHGKVDKKKACSFKVSSPSPKNENGEQVSCDNSGCPQGG